MTIAYPPIHDCAAHPRLPDGSCAACRRPFPPMAYPPVLVTAKTQGIAVLLSFLWLGAGHLYANRTATGVVLVLVDALLGCLALTGVGLVVALPVWIVLAPIVAVLSARAVTADNHRLGLGPR